MSLVEDEEEKPAALKMRPRSSPESELVKLIERLVTEDLARRRHKPQPPMLAMSKRQAAEASNLSLSTLEAAIRDGSLPAHKFGHRTLIRLEDHARWLASLPRVKFKKDAFEESV